MRGFVIDATTLHSFVDVVYSCARVKKKKKKKCAMVGWMDK